MPYDIIITRICVKSVYIETGLTGSFIHSFRNSFVFQLVFVYELAQSAIQLNLQAA